VLEGTGPAEVVEVVACSVDVATVGAEAGDRAVDDGARDVGGCDFQLVRDAGAKSFEGDVGPGGGRARARRSRLRSAEGRRGAGAESRVAGGRAAAQRIAFGRLDMDDARTEQPELLARECAGEVAREVDDEKTGERLHARGA